MIEWISSFLSELTQCTRVNQSYSDYTSIVSGVIQGNVLGPLLFMLYINDVTWLEVVQRDCQVRGLSREDAMIRGRWRKLIRMVDEQEGCEWMNVSSGTGSPG